MSVSVRGASFGYGQGNPVFENLAFDVPPGGILAVIGPNGCGKTTLLKCLVGVLDFKGGALELGGKAGLSALDRSRYFAYVPQLSSDPPPYTVERMVVLGRARFQGTFSRYEPKDYAIARDALEKVGIGDLADRAFNSLSGGERQLAMIAQALATESKALILDEPTSALDLIHQHDLVELMRRLSHDNGFTVIFTSHNPSHAIHVADLCLMMRRGGNYAFGPARKVITEASLLSVFGVDTRIVRLESENQGVSFGVVPVLKPFARDDGASA